MTRTILHEMVDHLRELRQVVARAAATGRWPGSWDYDQAERLLGWLSREIMYRLAKLEPAEPGSDEWLERLNTVTWVQTTRREVERLLAAAPKVLDSAGAV